MGLIRKSLAVGTIGVVRPNSKKQRVAKATMKSSAATAQAALATAQATEMANKLARERADEERAFRYATDPVYRKYIDDQRAAAAQAERVRLERQAEAERLRLEERRLRRELHAQQRRAAIKMGGEAAMLLFLGVAFLSLSLVVWGPQRLVGTARRRRPRLWRHEELRASWDNRRHRLA